MEPDYNKYFDYLDRLRESGIVNMFGVGQYLEVDFGISKAEARTILVKWMNTFNERHPKGEN